MIRLDDDCRFDATDTFECGQCFRWNRDDDGKYVGISGKRFVM